MQTSYVNARQPIRKSWKYEQPDHGADAVAEVGSKSAVKGNKAKFKNAPMLKVRLLQGGFVQRVNSRERFNPAVKFGICWRGPRPLKVVRVRMYYVDEASNLELSRVRVIQLYYSPE